MIPCNDALLKGLRDPHFAIECCNAVSINAYACDFLVVASGSNAALENFVVGLCTTDLLHVQREVFVEVPA